tara:strand:- start:16 stop:705 length:690 start_codon:yes stop_codon:yes gene_type:complete
MPAETSLIKPDYAPGIVLENVTKRYRVGKEWHTVLDDISFVMPRDKNLGILGRNGTGKTTLINLIHGQIFPDEGRIDHQGLRLSWPIGAACLTPSLSASDNVRFVARLYNVDQDEAIAFIQDFTELGKFMEMPVTSYSSGMRARLAFALSAMIDFDCYLVDEGFNTTDEKLGRRMKERFQSEDRTANIIVVSHSPGTIKRFCDCAVILDKGKLRYYDDVVEAIEVYKSL